jgi:fatty-acyl-CoA synthase
MTGDFRKPRGRLFFCLPTGIPPDPRNGSFWSFEGGWEALYLMPQVSEAAVVGVRHPRWVEAVVAVVVAKSGSELSEQDVLRHASAKLAPFKTPKRVVFADTLPKNPSGKLLKRQLRDAYAGLFQEL